MSRVASLPFRCVAFVALVLTCTPTLASSGKPLSEMLASEDEEERERGLALAQEREHLTDTELRTLVQSLRFGRLPDRITDTKWVYGPLTTDTPLTSLLIRHPKGSFALLLSALNDENYNVRRYSAFCLGRMCLPSAIPKLRQAFLAELEKSQLITAIDASGKESPCVSVLAAMAVASARLDGTGTVEWLFGLFVNGL
jgi:hypothetical protein